MSSSEIQRDTDSGRTATPRWWPALAATCAVVFVAGAATWSFCAAGNDPDRAWRALLINFIYFVPLALAMTVWPAVVRRARGTWAGGNLERTAMSALTFAPMSVILFVILVAGREHWAAWMRHVHPPLEQWLSSPFVFIRDGAAILLLWGVGAIYARRILRGRSANFAGWLVFLYCIVLTLIGMDMVMALNPHWYSALFGAYFFTSSAYAGLAAWTLFSLVRNPALEGDRKHDLGKLIVALSLMTAYMMYSQLLVIWYTNLPNEVLFVIPRFSHPPWRWVSMVLLGTIYLGPLVFLLPRWSKRSTPYLASACVAVLLALWVERWWLVTPTLGGEMVFGLPELSSTVACGAAMIFGMVWFAKRVPWEGPEPEKA